MIENKQKIILLGGASLVGQNLVARLKAKGYTNIVVLDKHRANLSVLKRVQPDITVEYANLSEAGNWQLPVEGLWVADTSYYYPEDRGISESIDFGKKMAKDATS